MSGGMYFYSYQGGCFGAKFNRQAVAAKGMALVLCLSLVSVS